MIRRLLAAAVMIAVAVVLVLLARDAWHWNRAVSDADRRAAIAPVGPGTWRSQDTFPFQLARRALSIGDDLRFRRAVMRAVAAAKVPIGQGTLKLRGPIETELARIEREDSDRVRASRAADYLGVLLYTDPEDPSKQSGPTPAERALAEFRNAVTIDPGNESAKRNLELMLQQVQTQAPQGSHKPGGGQKAGNRGAGVGPPGAGY